jgi:hypothetical protein
MLVNEKDVKQVDHEKDVKQVDQESSTENSPDQGDTAKKQDADGQGVKDRAIPYSRFKEKVDQVKDLERKMKAIEQQSKESTNKVKAEMQSYYESEIAKMKRDLDQKAQEDTFDDYLDDDDVKKINRAYEEKIQNLMNDISGLKEKVTDLSSQRESEVLRGQVTKLKEVYPSMDEEHVYAIKKIKPDWSLEECAEYSHNKWEEKLKTRWAKTMEEKKKAAKNSIFGDDGQINIKPEERPKTMKEAKEMMLKWAKNN